MKEKLLEFLKKQKKSTITLEELEIFVSGKNVSYEQFAQIILAFEAENLLQMIKAKGRNGKNPSLAFQYRIQKANMQASYHDELQKHRLQFHSLIKLDAYFSLDAAVWDKDFPYLQQISDYLYKHELPTQSVPAPERSFELVGDEKWITHHGGEECLKRIGLWTKLNIIPVADPLMLAVNPCTIQNQVHLHLIVENKTTYQALLEALPDTAFTTLIYGCGKKIIKSIECLHTQLPLGKAHHRLFYFGDIDNEGITIWHLLYIKANAQLALPFYDACLQKPYVQGKANQRPNHTALSAFLEFFPPHQQQHIQHMLHNGGYYPQEVLKTRELRQIWRSVSWNDCQYMT